MSEKCTPLRREAHFEVKMYKTHQGRTTFGSWDVEKVHAVVARSTFRSQNARNTTCLRHFWRFRCRFAWQAQGIVHLVKSGQKVRVLSHFQKPWQAWDIWRGSAKMHFPWQAQYKRHVHERCQEVRALNSWEGLHFGASNLQFGEHDFAWQVQRFVWLGGIFSWQAQYFRQVEWKHRKTHWYEAVSAALNFLFLKEVSQNCFVLMLSCSKIEEASQNCFVLDVVKFKNCRSLAELFRFWRCYVQKLRTSRRLA